MWIEKPLTAIVAVAAYTLHAAASQSTQVHSILIIMVIPFFQGRTSRDTENKNVFSLVGRSRFNHLRKRVLQEEEDHCEKYQDRIQFWDQID